MISAEGKRLLEDIYRQMRQLESDLAEMAENAVEAYGDEEAIQIAEKLTELLSPVMIQLIEETGRNLDG